MERRFRRKEGRKVYKEGTFERKEGRMKVEKEGGREREQSGVRG